MTSNRSHEGGEPRSPPSIPASPLDMDLVNLAVPAVRLVAKVVELLQGRQMSPLEAIQYELAKLELRDRMGVSLPTYVQESSVLVELEQRRSDHIVIGDRGSGKSVIAFRLAEMASACGREVVLSGLPKWVAEHFGYRWMEDFSPDEAPNGSFVLVDEAGLLLEGVSDRSRRRILRKCLAPGRHKDKEFCFVAQSLAMIDLEVLRFEVALWAKRFDVFRSAFDREQAQRFFEELTSMQGGVDDPRATWLFHRGRWWYLESELPKDWSERVSKCWE